MGQSVMIIDLSKIPDGWFLDSLAHNHTRIVCRGDRHTPLHWVAELQHITGGKLQVAISDNPQGAIDIAIEFALIWDLDHK